MLTFGYRKLLRLKIDFDPPNDSFIGKSEVFHFIGYFLEVIKIIEQTHALLGTRFFNLLIILFDFR